MNSNLKTELSTYHKWATSFIIVVFVAQSLSKAFIIADYFTNKSAYAKNCINKSRSQMHCNGKCQLMKKLLQEEKKDQENNERKSEQKSEVTLFLNPFSVSGLFSLVHTIQTKYPPFRSSGCIKDRSLEIFHPPQL